MQNSILDSNAEKRKQIQENSLCNHAYRNSQVTQSTSPGVGKYLEKIFLKIFERHEDVSM